MFEAIMAPVEPAAILDNPAEIAVAIPALPDGAIRMISAATKFEDPAQMDAVLSAARLAFPDHHSQIDQLVADLTAPTEPLLVTPLVVTGTPPEPQKYHFLENLTAKIDLNAAYTDGNTETSTLGSHLKASLKRKANIYRLEAYANTGEANGERTQENWGASYQMDTLWTDDVFGYVRTSLDSDQFAGFDYRAFLGAGAGYYFINDEELSLRGEVGPGYRFSKETATAEESGDWVLYGAVDTRWVLNEDWAIEHDSKLTLSEPSATLSSRSQLSTALTDTIRAGMSYELQYEGDPPEEKDPLDSILKFNVSYGF